MDRIEALLKKLPQDVDGAIITSSVNRSYLTGLRSSAGVVLVTRQGCYALLDFRYIEVAKKTIRNCEVILQDKLEEQLPELVKKHGIRRVALETGYQTIGEMTRYQKMLPEVEFLTDSRVNDAILELRKVKDEGELAAIRAAQKVTDTAFTAILDFIKPGKTEREIAAELEYLMKRNGGENPAFDTICVAGPNSSMPHGVPGDRPVQDGDFLTMDFGAMVDGYCSDMTRTVAVGRPSEEMVRVYDTVLKAQLAGIAAAHAGVTGAEVHEAGAKVIADAGYGEYFNHGFGHSLGIEIHEDPGFHTRNDKPIPAGALLSAEPGIYLPGRFGVRIEDVIMLTEDGCIDITHSPKQLIVL